METMNETSFFLHLLIYILFSAPMWKNHQKESDLSKGINTCSVNGVILDKSVYKMPVTDGDRLSWCIDILLWKLLSQTFPCLTSRVVQWSKPPKASGFSALLLHGSLQTSWCIYCTQPWDKIGQDEKISQSMKSMKRSNNNLHVHMHLK